MNATRGVTCSVVGVLRSTSAAEEIRGSFNLVGVKGTRGLRPGGPLVFGVGRCALDASLTAGMGGGVSWTGVGGR